MKSTRLFTPGRIIALVLALGLLLGVGALGLRTGAAAVSVPPGAHAGQLTMKPCTYPTENGGYRAECGTLVVPENRADPRSRLIALPVVRILARSPHPLAPVFRLNGGPGESNMTFPDASRLAARHDVVLVGYRGVDGSSVLSCPEVNGALESSDDLLSAATLRTFSHAFTLCAHRLERDGVDLAGYTLEEQAADIEAARVALGYQRIDLLSESEGTRLAMIYAWRYPGSVDRSAMIGVNPPGNFVYNASALDQNFGHYSTLCARDAYCRARTTDLAATLRHTAAHLPRRWLFLPVKQGDLLVGSFLGMADATPKGLSSPAVLDSWLAAAHGDPSGFWVISLLTSLLVPDSFVWGEFAAIGKADTGAAGRYFASPASDRGEVIGNPGAQFLWGGGGVVHAWPANPSENEYTSVPTSTVPTLLIGGTVDFETPAQNATRELLPHLPNGHQVVLSELGHSGDFWNYEPAAGTRLLTTFYGTGRVDTSLYTHHPISFAASATLPTFAKYLLGVMMGLALLAIGWLLWLALRVRRRGCAGRKTSLATRTVLMPVLGLGGWFLAALIVQVLWPTLFLGNELLAIVSGGGAIALGLYGAWTHRDRGRAGRAGGLLAASAGALLGGWFGYSVGSGPLALVTMIAAAAAAGNLALIALDIWRDRAAPGVAETTSAVTGFAR